MKKITSKFRSSFSLLLLLLFIAPASFANPVNDDVILEITDKDNQLTLGISKEHVFIVITEELRDFYNAEIKNYERKEWHTFADSGGNYIPGSHTYIDSEPIQIPLSDIHNISFKEGTIEVSFIPNTRSTFKNILSDLGANFFNNFNEEDLESFYVAYLNIR
ncbi:MAG: hypothetical protein JJ895_05990 [Balneolaceae bacterium]|nr:hypothetical protein [Balneolaceae bacterium]